MSSSEPAGSSRKDPVCDMKVSPETPFRTTYGEREYSFCSQHCLEQFRKDPAKFLKPPFFLDPVCGMSVQPDGEFRTLYEEREYIFCSRHCLSEFQEDPEKFIRALFKYFQCPTHPGVRQAEPGACPQCGLLMEAVRRKWVCPFHPLVLHDEPGECPVYGLPLIPEPPGRFYTCTLHPQVKELEPVKCPHCGMTLEPAWAQVARLRTEWFCSMHPEIVERTQGNCPKCGMNLNPRVVPSEEREPEEVAADRELWKKVCPKCIIENE